MADTNLGRVQGASVFKTTASSRTSINISSLTPSNIQPLPGDGVLFPNGDLRAVISKTTTVATLGDVLFNLKGATGTDGTSARFYIGYGTGQDMTFTEHEFDPAITGDQIQAGDIVITANWQIYTFDTPGSLSGSFRAGTVVGNIGSYWAVILGSSIPTHYGDAYISFSFTTSNGYDENLIGAELRDILLAPSVNIYKTQTDYASGPQVMDISELCSTIYSGYESAERKQIIKGRASIDTGPRKEYDCLLFVYESGTDVYMTIGLVDEDKTTVYMSRDVRLDERESMPTAGFFTGNS